MGIEETLHLIAASEFGAGNQLAAVDDNVPATGWIWARAGGLASKLEVSQIFQLR